MRHRKQNSESTFNADHASRILELDKILLALRRQCACELGQWYVANLEPLHDAAKVLLWLRETSEARSFLNTGESPMMAGFTDLREILSLASKGFLLDVAQLGKVARFAEGARRMKESLQKITEEEYPRLFALQCGVIVLPDVEKVLFNAIDPDNDVVRDRASVRLLKARRAIAATKDEIQEKLRSLLTNEGVRPHLQDNFITMRGGRYCLPVKAESRSAVPGIVHDRSSSGGAVFIEPQGVVDANNRLREWEAEEQRALEEILRDLTLRVNEASSVLRRTQKAVGKLDFAFAKGRLSQKMAATEPVLSEQPVFNIKMARHPLIENPIPNDIVLGENFSVLLITGPNTGGKTVVLKTLGLLTLMACCGLHIPAMPKSTLWIPGQIFADIGDEQSLEQSLSTFSAHLKNILNVVQNAREGDLILLDEVGAGTDPDEGAALAKAILRHLSRRKTLVVASTHFGELKRFALSAQNFKNASVEFDERSFRPTYHLRIGVPGSSNALHIARRLGMPINIVQRAKRYLGEEHALSEEASRQLEVAGQNLRDQQEDLQRSLEETQKIQREYERKIRQLEREKTDIIAQSQRELAAVIDETQREANAILHQLRQQQKESKTTETARGRLKTLRTKNHHLLPVKSTFVKTQDDGKFDDKSEINNEAPAEPSKFHRGDIVHVKQFNREGEVVSDQGKDGKYDVRIGAMKLRLEPFQLKSTRTKKPLPARVNVHIPDASSEINLIGKTADEAIYELEEHMDAALLAGLKTLWIIHGRGTGTLRKAVHQWLKSNSAVSQYELAPLEEGGEGATVVHLG